MKTHWQQYPDDTLPFCARMGQQFKNPPTMIAFAGPAVTCKICQGEIEYRRQNKEDLRPADREAERARSSYTAKPRGI